MDICLLQEKKHSEEGSKPVIQIRIYSGYLQPFATKYKITAMETIL